MFLTVKQQACFFCLAFSMLLNALFVQAAEAPAEGSVFLRRTTAQLTTCAFTEAEMRRLFEQIFAQRRSTKGRVSAFGDLPAEMERPALTEKNRLSALLHWESDLVLSENQAGEYIFSSTQAQAPWSVFLNGRYCGGWQDNAVAVQVSAGLCRLQFLAVQKYAAPVPALKIQKKGAAENSEQTLRLQSPASPGFARLEKAPAPVGDSLAAWQLKESYHFLTTDQYLSCYQKQKDGAGSDGEVFYRDAKGTEQKLPDFGELLLPGLEGVSLEWREEKQTQTFPSLPCWPLAIPVYIRASLSACPLLLSAREALSVQMIQPWPETLPNSLKDAWQLRLRQYGRAEELLSEKVVCTQYTPEIALQTILQSAVQRLSWQAEIAGIPVAEAVEVQIIRPGTFPQQLEFRGQHLLLDGKRAVLQCNPLQKREKSEFLQKRKTAATSLKLYYFDSGLGNTQSKREQTLGKRHAERFFQQLQGFSPGRIMLPETPGAKAELQSLAALSELLSMRPDLAILNLGERELQAGSTPLTWCKQMLFFTQTCLAADIEPILLTWPELPGIEPAVSRQSALLLKELGLNLGVTVVDLYSQRILDDTDTAEWYVDEYAEHQAMSRQGQQWLAEKVLHTLRKSTTTVK